MTATAGQLATALRAQAIELNSVALAGRSYSVAQQLVYQTCLDEDAQGLRLASLARLRQLVHAGRSLGLATRWTSSRPRRRLVSGYGEIRAVALASDCSFLIFSAADNVLWRLALSGQTRPEAIGRLNHRVSAISILPDNASAVTGDYSGAVVRWELASDKSQPTTLMTHAHYVRDVVVDQLTGTVYSGGDDGLIACWNGDHVREVARLPQVCITLAVSPSGVLFSGHQDGAIRRWDRDANGSPWEIGRHDSSTVDALVAIGDTNVVSITHRGEICAWELSGDGYNSRVVGQVDGGVAFRGLAFDQERLITAGRNGRVMSWNIAPAAADNEPIILGNHYRAVTAVAAESRVVITGGRDGFLIRWDGVDQGISSTADVEVVSVSIAPDGSTLLTGGGEGIHQWTPWMSDQRPPVPRQIVDTPVRGLVSITADEFVAYSDDGCIRAWDLADLSKPPLLVREKDKRNRSILRMAAVPGSRQVVTAMADGRILLWTIGHLPEPTLIGAARGAALAVSPDGRWAVTAGDEMAVMRWDLRDAADGTWLGNTAGAQIRALAVGGSPPRVFGGDDRGRIFSWDSSGADNWGRVIGRHGHDTDERPKRTRVRSIVIAEDNSWLASVADDGLIECWDTNSGALTSLQPVTLPNNITSAGGCLLASDKRGGLTLFDVVLGPAPSARPNRPVDLVLIVDQWWCNEIRGDHRLDLAALKADLCGDRIARAVIPCPHLPALHGFRKYLEGTGWTVPSAPPGRAAIEEIVSLAAEAAAHSEVLLVSGNSDFSARLSEVPHRDRITIIDDVARWSR